MKLDFGTLLQQNSSTSLNSETKEIITKDDRIKYLEQQLELEQYRVTQKFIVGSQNLRSEINIAINNDVPIIEVLEKALECIALMTNDDIFYSINMKKLKDYV